MYRFDHEIFSSPTFQGDVDAVNLRVICSASNRWSACCVLPVKWTHRADFLLHFVRRYCFGNLAAHGMAHLPSYYRPGNFPHFNPKHVLKPCYSQPSSILLSPWSPEVFLPWIILNFPDELKQNLIQLSMVCVLCLADDDWILQQSPWQGCGTFKRYCDISWFRLLPPCRWAVAGVCGKFQSEGSFCYFGTYASSRPMGRNYILTMSTL